MKNISWETGGKTQAGSARNPAVIALEKSNAVVILGRSRSRPCLVVPAALFLL
ncbi:MAG: hypothetical protein V5783_00130 [Pontiella sp.]